MLYNGQRIRVILGLNLHHISYSNPATLAIPGEGRRIRVRYRAWGNRGNSSKAFRMSKILLSLPKDMILFQNITIYKEL